jgi:hypothetical protein
MTKAWPPKGWHIKKAVFTEDAKDRPAGEYWQGVHDKGTTALYKKYDDCMDAVEWYDKGFKSKYAEPWGV